MEVVDSKSLLEAIGKYCYELEYQMGNKRRIGEILSLKDLCKFYEKKYLPTDSKKTNHPKNLALVSKFYDHVKAVCDQSLMFFICSEISNSVQAIPIKALLNQLTSEKHYNGKILVQEKEHTLPLEFITDSFNDLNSLFVRRYDQTVGAHILDFNISMFSAFECSITEISEIYGDEITEKYTLSKLKKFKKYLENYEKSENQKDKDNYFSKLRSVPGNFLSFPDKFNFVIDKARKNNYPRNLKIDKELVNFLRMTRNTVHNGGVHKGNNVELIYKGVTHRLIKNEPMYHEDYNDLIKLCASLVDIYDAIITSLKNDLF